ncbi:PIN domain-containing protein [Myceligenerans crystallogenes]|uniref:PIN domain-containing protein n=1 Tax=Myceligenerans crystallogenes TaxID=316335 RepID=A0ABN2N7B2_9MICO
MYVLDTNVISAVRVPGRRRAVERWVRSVPAADQYTTAMSISEIEQGIRRKRPKDAAAAAALDVWLHQAVLRGFRDRILPFDLHAARIHGR